jgi:hypothetical protein
MRIYLIHPRMLRFVRLAFCECQLIASMKRAISAASTGTYQIKGMRSKREITNAPMVPCSRKRIANTSHNFGLFGLHTGPALPREIAEQQQADGYERPLQ